VVDRYSPDLLQLARAHTDDADLAEDAVQEAWIAVLRGTDRFEGRSSLRTWIGSIFLRRLFTKLEGERRYVSLSGLAESDVTGGEPAVPAERFLSPDHEKWPGHWKLPPVSWGPTPEERLLSREARELIGRAIAALPISQRQVIALRDVGGWSAAEVCDILELTEANQRVLLHRARSRLRAALETYFMTEAKT
jgi:RNA polymerase sigma-70 factor (ECF subfamily)